VGLSVCFVFVSVRFGNEHPPTPIDPKLDNLPPFTMEMKSKKYPTTMKLSEIGNEPMDYF
jgi:hypothetical protein